jgi:hypothetical protein
MHQHADNEMVADIRFFFAVLFPEILNNSAAP